MKVRYLLSIVLVVCLIFSVGCAAPTENGEPSEPPRGRSLLDHSQRGRTEEDDSFATTTYADVTVGSFEEERHGVTFHVDFWDVPQALSGERIQGTLTYMNNTDEEIAHYLHAFVDVVGPFYAGELPYSTSPLIEPNADYVTVTDEKPLFVTLKSGEAITVNFSVAVPTEEKLEETTNFLTFGLSETETFKYSEALCDFYFVVS